MNDYNNDGRSAFASLRAHYDSTEKPRVLTLYEELTTLSMSDHESITDYIIRAERAATGLKSAGENITDNLVIAMLLKGLPELYKPFIVVHTQLDKYKTLVDFKAALTNYANTEALRKSSSQSQSCVLSSTDKSFTNYSKKHKSSNECFSCGKTGHRSKECLSKDKLKCTYCKRNGHVESVCFKKKKG